MLARHEKVHRTEIQSSTKDVDVRKEGDEKWSANGGDAKNDILTSRVASHQTCGSERPIEVQRTSSDGRRRRVARTLWRCDRCPYVTAKRSQHQTHRQLHGSGQRHTCRLCDYSVGGLHLLMQHVRLHHGGDAEAARTDAKPPIEGPPDDVPTSSSLKEVHVRPLFRCDRCPYANSRRDHLLCHSKLHSSDGPLRCPQCDYSVSKVHLLTQHLRVHQLSAADAQNSSRATKDQFMRSLKLTTR